MTTGRKLAEALNEYRGDNEWQDIIYHWEGVDWDGSDPRGDGSAIRLDDGTWVVWNGPDKRWEVSS